MTLRRGSALATVAATLLALNVLSGCGGDDDDETQEKEAKPVEGTFVGKAGEQNAFVAVVASPAEEGKRARPTTVFICDAETVCEWLTGSADGNAFTAGSDDDARAAGTLTAKAARGSIDLAGGEKVRFTARPAAATSGLYSLTISAKGKLTGASATGVGLTGRSSLPEPGRGSLKLADGTRLRFAASENSTDDPIRIRAGEARVIVLPGRQLRGAGKSPGEGSSDFFMRSPAG